VRSNKSDPLHAPKPSLDTTEPPQNEAVCNQSKGIRI
jgi:hypothetical protein